MRGALRAIEGTLLCGAARLRFLLLFVAALCAVPANTPAVAAPVSPSCAFLQSGVTRPEWFTLPRSRIVVNPGNVTETLSDGFGDGLPMNAAYYVGAKPVSLPFLWRWQPASQGAAQTAVTPGPSPDITPPFAAWDRENAQPEAVSDGMRIVLNGAAYGALSTTVTVDLNQTPCLAVDVPSVEGAWALKVNAGGPEDTVLQKETGQTGSFLYDVRTRTGWRGVQTFRVRLFAVGGAGRSVTVRFLHFAGFPARFVPASAAWAPHALAQRAVAEPSKAVVEATTCFADESTLLQRFRVMAGGPSSLLLTGVWPQGPGQDVRWDAAHRCVLLQSQRFHVAIAVGGAARWLGVSPSWDARPEGRPAPSGRGGMWTVAVDGVKPGAGIAVAARFTPGAAGMPATIKAARAPVGNFNAVLGARERYWNRLLATVPRPLDFQLRLLDAKGTTPNAMARAYYKAWVFLMAGVLPPMPENGFAYPQVACGKPSLWSEGDARAAASAQWESVEGIQFLAWAAPDTAWSALEGLLSLVQPDGTMGGEGLPTRFAQTAWTLSRLTGDTARLSRAYPALKRLLQWKIADPRWIFKGSTAPSTKDAEFVVHALLDAGYARQIALALGRPSEAGYWEQQAKALAENYRLWFWDAPGGVPYRLYNASTGERGDHGGSWNLEGFALPPEYLPADERDALRRLFHASLLPDEPFLIRRLTKHATYSLARRGAWRYGLGGDAARMAEAAMRDVTRAGVFSEEYAQRGAPHPSGVQPSLFGALNVIDGALWHNGVIVGEGLPILARVPGAAGVIGLNVPGGPINVRYNATGDGVALDGPGLRRLRCPPGFHPVATKDGTPAWRGTLAVGKELALQPAMLDGAKQ